MSHIDLRGRNKVPGKSGTYYIYAMDEIGGQTVYELEHETCGFGVEHLIVDSNMRILMETWEGLDEYERLCGDEEEKENSSENIQS